MNSKRLCGMIAAILALALTVVAPAAAWSPELVKEVPLLAVLSEDALLTTHSVEAHEPYLQRIDTPISGDAISSGTDADMSLILENEAASADQDQLFEQATVVWDEGSSTRKEGRTVLVETSVSTGLDDPVCASNTDGLRRSGQAFRA